MSVLMHEKTRVQLGRINGSRSGSFLFYGPESVGKATAACELARRLACPARHDQPDPACPVCRAFVNGSWPDFQLLSALERPSITIEQVRQLSAALAGRAYQPQNVRMALINDAHRLTIDAQNALLKLIEEPPPATIIVLVTTSPEQLLDTIRSRCVAIFFPPPPASTVAGFIAARTPGLTPVAAAELVATAGGLPGAALKLAGDPEQAGIGQALAAAATAVSNQPLFERLFGAARLIEAKADLWRFGLLLQQTLVSDIRAGRLTPAETARSLTALEQFRRGLAAKITPRIVLERLMVEF